MSAGAIRRVVVTPLPRSYHRAMGYEVPAPKPRGAAGDGEEPSTERPIDRFRRARSAG